MRLNVGVEQYEADDKFVLIDGRMMLHKPLVCATF